METQARIEQVFQEKGVARGGEQYLRVSDARDLLADLVDAGRAVVGIDGVELREGETRPLSEAIADFSQRRDDSWRAYVRRCATQAKEFLDTLPDRETVYVALTTFSRDEWRQYGD
ncbi:MAG: hypothetical protein ABEK75_07560 [Salinibacter sp.]